MADARALKSLAEAFLKPEISVKTNGLMGRNYYDRPSAPMQMEDEDADGTLTYFCKHCNEGLELLILIIN